MVIIGSQAAMIAGAIGVAILGVRDGAVSYRATPSPDAVTVAVGPDPRAVAVDEVLGRAFVAAGSVSIVDLLHPGRARAVSVANEPFELTADASLRRIFVTTLYGNGSLTVLDALSGTLVRTIIADASRDDHLSATRVAIDDRSEHVFASGDTSVVMIDARSGAILHSAPVGDNGIDSFAVDGRTSRVFFTYDQGQYAGVVSARDGTIVRRVTLYHRTAHQDTISGTASAVDERTGRVFICDTDNKTVSMLDASSGRLLRTTPVGATPSAVAIDDRTSRAFVANEDGQSLSVLNASSGALLRTVPIGRYLHDVAVDRRARTVLVTATGKDAFRDPGSVRVLDEATGATLRVIPVGKDPASVAVDEAVGRAIVTNLQDGTVSIVDTGRGSR